MPVRGDSPPDVAASRGTVPPRHRPAARLTALVISEQVVANHPLPDAGDLLVGRSPKAAIHIPDQSISREHATLTLGPVMTIRDLGSANGTVVRGQRLRPHEPAPLAIGEAVAVGSATLLIQRHAEAFRPRRFWAHDYFEVRLEEECARAERAGPGLALARLHFEPSVPAAAARHALAEVLRASDVIGEYGPGEYEVLLLETGAAEADRTMGEMGAELSRRGMRVRSGLVCFPRDGRSPHALLARAGAQMYGARSEADANAPVVLDPAMKDLYRLVDRIAAGSIGVLLLGETGVGKEVLAEEIHRRSPRADKPFVRLNCAALPEAILESELFGHERGAFTGAVHAKQGLLEAAAGGTVFLDEVGELPSSVQAKLLRVIEDRQVLRVGAVKPRAFDVRFIAATNRDLEAAVEGGVFRRDLYFRLNGATIYLPPLRERPAEIEALARAFLRRAARDAGVGRPPELAPEAMVLLRGYSWPGNIRELRNVIERAVLLAGKGPVTSAHLPLEKMRVTYAETARRADPDETQPGASRRPRRATAHLDNRRIVEALDACGGNQTRAADLLGVSRGTLISRIRDLGLTRPRKR